MSYKIFPVPSDKQITTTHQQGRFYVDDLTGSAGYLLSLALPPLTKGPELRLQMQYDSNKGHGLFGTGFDLRGIPTVILLEGHYYLDGHIIQPEALVDGGLRWAKNNGAQIILAEVACETALAGVGRRWQATRVEDVYGNYIAFSYAHARPSRIIYGLRGRKNPRSVEFDYDKTGKLLENITTCLDGKPVRAWKMVYQGQELFEIHLLAFKGDGECYALEAPVSFEWAPQAGHGSAARMIRVSEPCRLVTDIDYAAQDMVGEGQNVVASYTCRSAALRGGFEYRTSRHFKGRRTHALLGQIFAATTAWDESSKCGRYVEFADEPEQSHLVRRSGSLAAAVGDAGENSVAIIHNSGRTEFHYKISEQRFIYENCDRGPQLQEVETVEFADRGAMLLSGCQKYFYNARHQPVRIQREKTTEFIDYLIVGGNDKTVTTPLSVPMRLSVYDGILEKVDETRLLKRSEFEYEFGNGTRPFAATAVQRRSWIGADAGVMVEKVRFDPWGYPLEGMSSGGISSEIFYDEYHFQNKITYISQSGDSRMEEVRSNAASGLVAATCNPQGVSNRRVYDAFGTLLEEWGPDLSRPLSWKDAGQQIKLLDVAISRDPGSGMTITESASGPTSGARRQRVYMDALGRILRSERLLGGGRLQVELMEYSAEGIVSRRSLPFLQGGKGDAPMALSAAPVWQLYRYDEYGRPLGVRLPDGSGSDIEYLADVAAARQAVRTYEINGAGERSLADVEVRGRAGLLEVQRAREGAPIRYEYDSLGRISLETDPSGMETIYTYDGFDRLIFEKNIIRGVSEYEYGPCGLLVRRMAGGQTITYDYDDFGRITQKQVATGEGGAPQIYKVEYLEGRKSLYQTIRETMPGGFQMEVTFAPNGTEIERRVRLAEDLSFTLTSTLTGNGEIAARHYPQGRVAHNVYGASGLLRRVQWGAELPLGWGNAASPIVEYKGHDRFGRPAETSLHNGVVERRHYDDAGQLQSFNISCRSGDRAAYIDQVFEYTGGGFGLLSRISDLGDNGQAKAFEYDSFGRLHKYSSHPAPDAALLNSDVFQYGPAGNFSQVTTAHKAQKFSGPNPYQPKIAAGVGSDQVFDKAGNLVFRTVGNKICRHYFDADNRLIRSRGQDDTESYTSEFIYDFDGSRFFKSDGLGVRSFYLAPDYQLTLYPDGRLLATIKVQGADGTVATLTEVLPNDPEVGRTGGDKLEKEGLLAPHFKSLTGSGHYSPGMLYLHKNNIGSLVLVTNEAGDKTASLSWGVWGQLDLDKSAGHLNFEPLFGDMVLDPESGLFYAGDRYYDPESRRFLSPDRMRSSADPYSYAGNDPVNCVDYNGMWWVWDRIRGWWNNPQTAQVGARFQRVATVAVNALFTVTVMSNFFDPEHSHAEDLAPVVMFMSGFAITFQTVNYINTANHEHSCLAPLWRRICCCRNFCIRNEGVIGIAVSMVSSATLFPLYYLTYNGIIEHEAGFNETLIANRTVSASVIGYSVPTGLFAGFMAALPGFALTSSRLPFLAIMQGSVVGGVLMEMALYELIFGAFSAGSLLAQVLFEPDQFSAVLQQTFAKRLLIVAPLIIGGNPLVAILPISNIPGITTGPMLLADGLNRAPFFPPGLYNFFCPLPPDLDVDEDGGPQVQEVIDGEEDTGVIMQIID